MTTKHQYYRIRQMGCLLLAVLLFLSSIILVHLTSRVFSNTNFHGRALKYVLLLQMNLKLKKLFVKQKVLYLA